MDALEKEQLWQRVDSYYTADPTLDGDDADWIGEVERARGEIWLVEFATPAEAGELATTRPALIVSADRFNGTRSPTVVGGQVGVGDEVGP